MRFDGRIVEWNGEFAFMGISFDQAGKATAPGSKWRFTFKDVYDKDYESEVYVNN